ncbi:MAG: DUF1573 domain-containing protein [Chitinophagia bacterium]|nr:DUF1573 domain-containing protein [Chitinophagia bacterium]
MKQLILTFGLAIASVVTFAQDANKPAANPNAPKFQFKDKGDTYDFGTIPEGPVAEHIFEFKNIGKEPLVIQNATGSCGCTTPEWPKEPILPGKSGVIKVKYDTQRVGGIYKTVTVNSNAKSGVQTLTIKGNVEAKPVEETFPQNPTPQGAPVEKKG